MNESIGIDIVDLNEYGKAYVMDNVIPEDVLQQIDEFRQSLPLDNKRPTVDRRFFADGADTTAKCLPQYDSDRPLASMLESSIQSALLDSMNDESESLHCCFCKVFRYMRFLEYARKGQGLDPHTDGTKTCEDTKKVSTHTLLLYLTNCAVGGETILMKDRNHKTWPVKPKRGRILLFPHRAWHEGAPVVDVPKICLRSEVCLEMN